MQSKLDEAHPQPPGTATDPNLYDRPEALDPTRGASVPIALQTDTAGTAAPRDAQGTGSAAPTASSAKPQAASEDAQLSTTPGDEPAVNRQPVPPEYRDLFDRLSGDAPGSTTGATQ